jgi:hypothetical protein
MKKFGTPTDGAPGSDTEYVGFRALGTPWPVGTSVLRVARRVRVARLRRVVEWRCRVACGRERITRWVAGSERELTGSAADVDVFDVRVAPRGVDPVVVPTVVVVE